MPTTVTRVGRYQAQPVQWELAKSQTSESSWLQVGFACTAFLDGAEWIPLEPPQLVEGMVFLTLRDGAESERGIRDLIYVLGWDGNFATLTTPGWKPRACEVTVESETYKEQVRFRVRRISAPGSYGVAKEIAGQLQRQCGGTAARLLAEAAAKGIAPAPVAPPAAVPPSEPEPQPMTQEEIPF
jgi:hypothetical protein